MTPRAVPTRVLRVDPERPEPEVLAEACAVLRAGGLVAMPTETVYGLAALAEDSAAVSRIYEAKGRPSHNPLIVHTHEPAAARALASAWPPAAEALAQRFWPGPLTVVVPRGERLSPLVSAGGSTVALRVPAHPVALALLRALGRPLAAPSANPSNGLSPTRAEHVLAGLGGRLELVLDGGPCAVGIESTVVDAVASPPRVLRPGTLSLEELREAVPELEGAPEGPAEGALRSPGMLARHYAPRALLRVLPRGELERAAREGPAPVALLACGRASVTNVFYQRVLPGDPAGFAAELFEALHAVDGLGCAVVLVEAPPRTERWAGVWDRLTRASAPQ